MKVLHIINTLAVGGAERLLVDSLPIMKAMGIDVKVVLLVSSGSKFEEQIRDAGITVCSLDLRLGEYDPRIPFKLHLYMRWADVVHVHLFPSQYWAALAHVASRKNVLVTTEHSTSNTRARHWLTSMVDRWIYGLYDGIICISDATADFMRSRAPRRVQIATIENGVVLPETCGEHLPDGMKRQDVVPGVTDSDFLMLQVARFSDQKNQDCVLRALPLLPQDVHVAFAGYGKRLDACKELAVKLGVTDRAHFLGMREDIARLWSVADIGVMSSQWEGFGLAAVEGMAYAKPVLASAVPGLADVVKHESLLFAPDDERELADKVMHLYSDAADCKRLGEWCRQRARMFDIRTMVNKYMNFYKALLAQRQG